MRRQELGTPTMMCIYVRVGCLYGICGVAIIAVLFSACTAGHICLLFVLLHFSKISIYKDMRFCNATHDTSACSSYPNSVPHARAVSLVRLTDATTACSAECRALA